MDFDVGRLPGLYTGDPARVEVARRRQAAVWRGEKPDLWPAIAQIPVLTDAQKAIPNPDFKQAFDSVDWMLCSQVRLACGVANAGSDAVPSVRGNYGTGMALACVGLDQEVFPDKMPWLKRHLTPEQAARLTPDDIRVRGAVERGLDYMRRHKALMGDRPMLYCMDTQGPFDLAHLMLGDDLFYLVYDDPPFVHHVLGFCVELATRLTHWMKAVSGEPADVCHHTNSLYMENGGIRICEDSTVLLGPGQIREFAIPYSRRLAQRFGGAWVHYCGRNDELTRAICEAPEFRGINFGHVPGHEHEHPFEQDMAWIRDRGKICFGGWPRRPGEEGEAYLRRMLEWARQGCLIPQIDPAVGPGGYPDIRAAVDAWYAMQ
jgi:hypothetical protein